MRFFVAIPFWLYIIFIGTLIYLSFAIAAFLIYAVLCIVVIAVSILAFALVWRLSPPLACLLAFAVFAYFQFKIALAIAIVFGLIFIIAKCCPPKGNRIEEPKLIEYKAPPGNGE